MKYMGLNQIRETFLKYFESKGHIRLPSFSLVPENDPSLLLINSGMAPMKKYFTGEVKPPGDRVATCQKCIRTPDIERVGKTARHGTFFEMLGNFSFGDYFKKDAALWAWEFVTEVLNMPKDRLWVSIYCEDEETFDIWTKDVGIPAERIVRLGKCDNFWEHGTGPCGPCSELYFDRGISRGCGEKDCAVGCDCDRFVEFWNLVFTQFDSDGKGCYSPLEKPNIDTGMGLERLACIMQDVGTLFEVDTVRNIMEHVSSLCGVKYGKDSATDVSLRVITDHIRSTVFMAGDGISPSNEGRGYVLRRLLRRAARHGKLLGMERPFLHEICDTVISENLAAYPELCQKRELIRSTVLSEEERFSRTINQGLALLTELMTELKEKNETVLSGINAFRLYDTYGFPPDLTRDILQENGLDMDQKSFDENMEEQRSRARAARKNAVANAWKNTDIKSFDFGKTEFVGYSLFECDASLLGIFEDEDKSIFITDRTPFYAESGGQAGDKGVIEGEDGVFEVLDCKKTDKDVYLHYGKIKSGEFHEGQAVFCKIDTQRRRAIMRNHSATHLLHKSLCKILGEHVEQAGSYVDNERLRFDFTHFTALTDEEISKTEELVNRNILTGIPVETLTMSLKEARSMGAATLFGEKYKDTVRVIKMGDFSAELCGGTHIENTALAGLFKILSESSVAAGVRRIEAVTGTGVLDVLNHAQALVEETSLLFKTTPQELTNRARQILDEQKDDRRRIEALDARIAAADADALLSKAEPVGDTLIITERLYDVTSGQMRVIGDMLRDKAPNVVAVLAAAEKDKSHFLAVCGTKSVANKLNAGTIVKYAAKEAGGGGGGRPDSASAGGGDVNKIDDALIKTAEMIRSLL